MKVLLDSNVPFALAHGGAQIQIEQTKKGLEGVGVEVEGATTQELILELRGCKIRQGRHIKAFTTGAQRDGCKEPCG